MVGVFYRNGPAKPPISHDWDRFSDFISLTKRQAASGTETQATDAYVLHRRQEQPEQRKQTHTDHDGSQQMTTI